MVTSPSRRPVDFERNKRRSRFEAVMLDAMGKRVHAAFGDRKSEIIGAMSGTVVELGPGTGANMRYYADGVRVIAIEPNPVMHDRLRAAADEHGVDLEIRTLRGESIDVDDESADAVVGTLLLCGVDDPAAVVGEAKRVLRPGGTYFFLEHVAAPAGTPMRRFQQIAMRPHRWTFNGCEIHRETADVLRAAGFAAVEIDDVVSPLAEGYVRYKIIGTATK